MTIKEFSSKILRCSNSLWWYVLRGERNLRFAKAQLASQVLDTCVEVWIDSRRKAERQEAWVKFNK